MQPKNFLNRHHKLKGVKNMENLNYEVWDSIKTTMVDGLRSNSLAKFASRDGDRDKQYKAEKWKVVRDAEDES
jgi:hypothetical protein